MAVLLQLCRVSFARHWLLEAIMAYQCEAHMTMPRSPKERQIAPAVACSSSNSSHLLPLHIQDYMVNSKFSFFFRIDFFALRVRIYLRFMFCRLGIPLFR